MKWTIIAVAAAWMMCAVVQGAASHKLVIELNEPAPRRPDKKMPASVHIDFREILHSADARIDPQSLKLRHLDANSEAVGESVPVRFDDPDPKPDSFHFAYLGGGGQNGDLVFQHQSGSDSIARYQLDY